MDEQGSYEGDLKATQVNRARLQANTNLVYWYRNLYNSMFGGDSGHEAKTILEIGSGTSPLKQFYPQVITSDILELDYLDHIFDCHDIDQYAEIANHSVDIITLTNVLHHLRDPIRFLKNATVKLKGGGRVMMLEPYFSLISYPIYRLLHHEPVDFGTTRPLLEHVNGPLSTANQAIPYMIFFTRPDWRALLADHYDLTATKVRYFSSISYMLTGGISRRFPIPGWLYKTICAVDSQLAILSPRLFASFFLLTLTAR